MSQTSATKQNISPREFGNISPNNWVAGYISHQSPKCKLLCVFVNIF
jgi:hypothetical protein